MKKYVDLGYSPCVNTRQVRRLRVPRPENYDPEEDEDEEYGDEGEEEIEESEVAGYSNLRDARIREYLNYPGFFNANTVAGISNWRTISVDDISS